MEQENTDVGIAKRWNGGFEEFPNIPLFHHSNIPSILYSIIFSFLSELLAPFLG